MKNKVDISLYDNRLRIDITGKNRDNQHFFNTISMGIEEAKELAKQLPNILKN